MSATALFPTTINEGELHGSPAYLNECDTSGGTRLLPLSLYIQIHLICFLIISEITVNQLRQMTRKCQKRLDRKILCFSNPIMHDARAFTNSKYLVGISESLIHLHHLTVDARRYCTRCQYHSMVSPPAPGTRRGNHGVVLTKKLSRLERRSHTSLHRPHTAASIIVFHSRPTLQPMC